MTKATGTERRVFTISDHLDHAWTHELVGFPIDGIASDAEDRLCVRDDRGDRLPAQVARDDDGRARLYFVIDRLPPRSTRTFTLERAEAPAASPFHVAADAGTVILSNGRVAVKLPAACDRCETFPAPILGLRRGDGDWIGEGRLHLSDFLSPASLESRKLAEGPYWLAWQLVYRCADGETYTVTVTLYHARDYLKVSEESHFCHDAHWEFSLKKNLAPTAFWTHPGSRNKTPDGRRILLQYDRVHRRSCLGALTLPMLNTSFDDDYEYAVFLNPARTRDAVGLVGIHGGAWDYPYENQIDFRLTGDGEAFLRLSIKAGHRHWLLTAADAADYEQTDPAYATPIAGILRSWETPLDAVKDYILDWDETPAAARPFLLADRAQLEHSRRVAREYAPLRDYVARCDPDLPGDFTYYSAATHRTFEEEGRWNDPAVLYVTAECEADRRKQAGFLKDVVLDGLKSRRDAFLVRAPHDRDARVLNVGRGMRPWAALYDFAAAEGVFSEPEQKLARAIFAFLCYKATDPDYWPTDAITRRDDHPRSAHRLAWFPNRHSDWSMYNIDNIPHNFHNDLWTAVGCAALAFPRHPRSREWVRWTLRFWEAELDNWVLPEGAWVESTTYTLGTIRDYVIYCRALANARIRDYFTDERLQRVFRWLTEILLPTDKRIDRRCLPVLGDGKYPNSPFLFGWMAGLSTHDPEFAKSLQWAWRQTAEGLNEPGRFGLNFLDFLFIDPFLPDEQPAIPDSKWYRGLGAVLRSGRGTPEECYLFVKSGLVYSHFHEPEGTFQLWWHGVPLCDEFGVQYGKGTSEICNHNCIEILGGSPCVYNKGDLTAFRTLPGFDFVVAEAPIQQLYLQPGECLWGFRGEAAPAGWHRRLVLFVKPYYVLMYDELDCPHPTVYHLSVKAREARQQDNQVLFSGEYGVNLQLVFPALGGRRIEHGTFGVPRPRMKNQAAHLPDDFYDQRQVHVAGEPYQDIASLLLPFREGTPPPRVGSLPQDQGLHLEFGEAEETCFLFPSERSVEHRDVVYRGQAGSLRRTPEGVVFHQAEGTYVALRGVLGISGDGPFTAHRPTDARELQLETDGVARWLRLEGVHAEAATCAGGDLPVSATADGAEMYVPAGPQCVRVALQS